MFIEQFYEKEKELEGRALGDIDIELQRMNECIYNMDFTLDEIKQRYWTFLNYKVEEDEEKNGSHEGSSKSGHLSEDPTRRSSLELSAEIKKLHEMDEDAHELNELKSTSIETAYQDYNYWKPDVDLNIEDLLSEIKK